MRKKVNLPDSITDSRTFIAALQQLLINVITSFDDEIPSPLEENWV
jgi:hypothetical protein